MAASSGDAIFLGDFRTVGRSLSAARAVQCGEVVLTDAPLAAWDEDPLAAAGGERLLLLAQRHGVPPFLAAAAGALLPLVIEAQVETGAAAALRRMHVPTLPIGAAQCGLQAFCFDVLSEQQPQPQPSPTHADTAALVHAVMAAKVNAHRGPDGRWCMLPTGSKLAHSCDPNLLYRPASFSFVACRDIRQGEALSFSYIGGPLLIAPTEARQQRMVHSHLFTCVCARCGGPDRARRLRCPACGTGSILRRTSPLLAVPLDAWQGEVAEPLWRCDRCAFSTFRDSDADPSFLGPVAVAAAVGAQEEAITLRLGEYGAGRTLRLVELLDLLRQAHAIGPMHHTVAEAAALLCSYYRQMVAGVGAAAVPVYLAWVLHHILLLEKGLGIRAWPVFEAAGAAAGGAGPSPRQAAFPHMLVCRQMIAAIDALVPLLRAFAVGKTATAAWAGADETVASVVLAFVEAVLPAVEVFDARRGPALRAMAAALSRSVPLGTAESFRTAGSFYDAMTAIIRGGPDGVAVGVFAPVDEALTGCGLLPPTGGPRDPQSLQTSPITLMERLGAVLSGSTAAPTDSSAD